MFSKLRLLSAWVDDSKTVVTFRIRRFSYASVSSSCALPNGVGGHDLTRSPSLVLWINFVEDITPCNRLTNEASFILVDVYLLYP